MTESGRWMRLDNAAKIYPAASSRRWHALFRLSATLTEPVDPDVLLQAQRRMVRRFPSFYVRLRRGMFWYYLEGVDECAAVEPDGESPCMPLQRREKRGLRLRVRYRGNRIAVEFFHAITDGTGGLCFLKTLVAEYLSLRYGVAIPRGDGVLDCDEPPHGAELDDSFLANAGDIAIDRTEANAYHLSGDLEPDGFIHLTTACVPLAAVTARAKAFGVSLTAYLTALLIDAACQLQQEDGTARRRRRPVKICVPVNLRRFFPSETLRNFSSYVNPGVETRLGTYTLEEIVQAVHHYMGTEATAKRLGAKFTANVSSERNAALRLAPLFLKNVAMKCAFLMVGDRKTTTILSNLGLVTLPDAMAAHVSRMEFVLGPLSRNPVACAALSYGDTLCLNLTSTLREPALERAFLTRLVRQGVPVRVESNQR
jgi:hypothetical protein